MQKEDYFLKFDSIVKSFSASGRIALVHDLDADGISSGAITYNAIAMLRGKAPDLVITQEYKTVELMPKTLAMLKKNKIETLVIVDFALEQSPESVQKAMQIVKNVVVIDHHKDYGAKVSSKFFVIKPQFVSEIEPSRYPCAKFCFDLFSRHVNLSKWSWVACVGLMGDNQLAQWKDFVEKAVLEHNTRIDELWQVTNAISAVETLAPSKLHKLFFLVTSASHPREIISSEFYKYVAKLNSQSDKLLNEFKKKRVVFPSQELVWFEFKAKNEIKSVLINKVSNEFFPDKTVIMVQDKGEKFLYFSARRQDFKVKTNELLENAVRGMKDAGAGGHVPASAGRIRKRDLKEFKRRVLSQLSS